MRLALVLAVLGTTAAAGQYKPTNVPVEYSCTMQMVGALGAASAYVKVHIERFTTDKERQTLLDALRTNGYQTFLPALRKTPIVGYLSIKDQKWDLRWAHQELRDLGQVVTVATSTPVYFAGGGGVEAKSRTGYEMAVLRIEVDTIGMGKGTFAAAARVKPNADSTGVTVDDYAGEPMPITTVTRIMR
jgi:hypothetical protein